MFSIPPLMRSSRAVAVCVMVFVAAACGASETPSRELRSSGASFTTARPRASTSPASSASPVARVTTTPEASVEASGEAEEPEGPNPSCPNAYDGKEPVVKAFVSSGDSVRLTEIGSTVASCTTVGTSDGVPTTPESTLTAHLEDQLTLTLSSPWRLVRWSSYVSVPGAENTVVWPRTEAPERPSSIAVFAIGKRGETIVGFELVAMRSDGAAVARLSGLVRVDVR
jgi:hypothetical protein